MFYFSNLTFPLLFLFSQTRKCTLARISMTRLVDQFPLTLSLSLFNFPTFRKLLGVRFSRLVIFLHSFLHYLSKLKSLENSAETLFSPSFGFTSKTGTNHFDVEAFIRILVLPAIKTTFKKVASHEKARKVSQLFVSFLSFHCAPRFV